MFIFVLTSRQGLLLAHIPAKTNCFMHNFLSSELQHINKSVYCILVYIRVKKIDGRKNGTHVEARKIKGKHFSELKPS